MGFLWDFPSDKLRYLLKMAIEIVDLPIKNGGSFHGFAWISMGLELHGAAWIALRPWDMGAGSLRTCRCAFSTRSSEAGFANGDVQKWPDLPRGWPQSPR